MRSILLVISFLFSFGSFAQVSDTLLKANYTLKPGKGYELLSIDFAVSSYKCDTCKSVFQKFFGNVGSRTGQSTEGVKNEIVRKLQKNKNIIFYIEIPDYIEKIISLIDTDEKKEKARAIYRTKNIETAASISSSHATKYEKGKTSNNSSFSIQIQLTCKSSVSVTIPSQKFVYDGNMYTLESFQINF